MISLLWAVEVVQRYLRDESAELGQPPMVIIRVERHSLGWLVVCQSPKYARTRDPKDAWIGHGPFLVDALDGSLHMVHRQFCSDDLEWEDQYREKIRGEVPPRELDVEVRRLLDLGRRFDAFKAVRHASSAGLSPADALRYVEAIGAGLEVPDDLVAQLPQPDRRYLAIHTYSGPNPEPPAPAGQARREPGLLTGS